MMITPFIDTMPVLDLDVTSDGMLVCKNSYLNEDFTKVKIKSNPSDFTLNLRLIGLHLGLDNLISMEDLQKILWQTESRLRHAALEIPEFRSLPLEDQEFLLIHNAPLFFQLYLAMYINGGSGYQQLKSLITDKDVLDTLSDISESLLTVTFRYFSTALQLFNDKTYEEMYETHIYKMRNLTRALHKGGDQMFNAFVRCIILYPGAIFREDLSDIFHKPTMINRIWAKYSKDLCGRRKMYPTAYNLAQDLDSLRSIASYYSAHANIQKSNADLPLLSPSSPMETILNESSIIDQDSEWVQNKIFQFDQIWQQINLDQDVNQVALNYVYNYNDEENVANLSKILIRSTKNRMRTILSTLKRLEPELQLDSKETEDNIETATSFALLVFETLSGTEQLDFVLGQSDKNKWIELLGDLETSQKFFLNFITSGKAATYFQLIEDIVHQPEIFTLCCLVILSMPRNAQKVLKIHDVLMDYLANNLILIHGQSDGIQIFMNFLAFITHFK